MELVSEKLKFLNRQNNYLNIKKDKKNIISVKEYSQKGTVIPKLIHMQLSCI
jgi:hypothetical protein